MCIYAFVGVGWGECEYVNVCGICVYMLATEFQELGYSFEYSTKNKISVL